ncbi:class A sortase [Sporolactobacillus sp. STSJ-5]|uniref:class A sortase n=1 Tax=Sporolactobacillus sp. STSJ-5 TaxID=2965076 RepID=UPI002102661D|nr:class A sortase [Sporolactobacillus sp. STSJ-5]MCQ2009888.1 class A sortase [Sporolactobacillus sp. STSJ-5]
MRWKWTVLAAILAIAGILLIFSPFIKESIIGYMSTHFTEQKVTAAQLHSNNSRKATFDFETIRPPSVMDTFRGSAQQNPKAMIGLISIDSVGIHLPILKGTTNANLLVGATTMRPDQKMGQGNYPLAGHHMRRPTLLFSPLLKIKIGARIVITDLKKDYVYEVTSRKTVDASNTDVIQQTKKKQITLVTCDREILTDGRLIVQGKLIKVTDHHAN